MKDERIIVIGAGIAGLTAGALLLQAGYQVTVLEAQTYPGGCAGTFPYQGYRFDAGATLVGGFNPGGPHQQVAQQLGLTWPVESVAPVAWSVHLPDGRTVRQWTNRDKWQAERTEAFPTAERFWRKQSLLADIAWDVSSRPFPWPPGSLRDVGEIVGAIRPKTLLSTPYILRTIGSLMPQDDPMLNAFVDANLLISAQTTAQYANALYGSAALELPRRGANHVIGGIGALADTLVSWIRQNDGEVDFRQQVSGLSVADNAIVAVQTNEDRRNIKTHNTFPCDAVLANLTPWKLKALLGKSAPSRLRKETTQRPATWGAFMLYLGLRADKLPPNHGAHHQVVVDHTKPLGETNSVFLSLSDEAGRAPDGMIAANISTHTEVAPWWALRTDPTRKNEYHERRDRYVEGMLDSAEKAIPGIKQAVDLILPATPVTYEQWTGRPLGMVGGFAQKSILQARGPWTGLKNCWLVGDSVFPGQSTAGVTLSAMRVAREVARRI